jgi:BirA family biotin operon repressor/biotin-[acetyl-CoA-carboxylase] ligase
MPTKDRLLAYLKEKKGNWVSGEALSTQLAVSRTAIWKHISTLREEGYTIESSPKKGYLLRKISDLLLPNEIREGLDTKVFGRKGIVYHSKINSTNTKAKELASGDAPEGTLVVAEQQVKGRGRKGRTWFSPSQGGIYISLILKPHISPGEAPKITMLTGVVVAETLLKLTPCNINIKWPNDILVNGKKIAGILTEMSTEMDAIEYIVVGLGMNVTTPRFPDDIKDKATSILIETGQYFSRVTFIREYLKWYEKYYDIFKNIGFAPVIQRWKEFTDIIGHMVIAEVSGKKYIGEVHDIDNDGILILKDKNKNLHRIFSGDVTLV